MRIDHTYWKRSRHDFKGRIYYNEQINISLATQVTDSIDNVAHAHIYMIMYEQLIDHELRTYAHTWMRDVQESLLCFSLFFLSFPQKSS